MSDSISPRTLSHSSDRPTPLADRLTEREREVVAFIARGLTNREISAALECSENTVKSFVRSVYQKIGVERRAAAVAWALSNGLLSDGVATSTST